MLALHRSKNMIKKVLHILFSFTLLVALAFNNGYAKGKTKKKSKGKYASKGNSKKYTKKKKAPVKAIAYKDTLGTKKVITSSPSIYEESVFGDNDLSYTEPNDIYLGDSDYDATGLNDTINVNPFKIDFSSLIEDSVYIKLQGDYDCDYTHPFKGNVTSGFGPRWRRQHCGIDIDLETGDSVRSAFEGTVRIARKSPSFGNVVMIRHKNGLETIYAHLSKLEVVPGQHVESGDLIGLGGNTGHSFGSHLHFEVRYKGYPFDPSKIISFEDFCLSAKEITITKETFDYLNRKKNFASSKGGRTKYYKVRKGDNLSVIAKKLGTTTAVLKRLNGISNPKSLKAGKVLKYI